MDNKETLIIKISEQYSIKCSYIESNNKDTMIQLHNKNQQQDYLLSTSIKFAENLFTNPQEFKIYKIELYGTEYCNG